LLGYSWQNILLSRPFFLFLSRSADCRSLHARMVVVGSLKELFTRTTTMGENSHEEIQPKKGLKCETTGHPCINGFQTAPISLASFFLVSETICLPQQQMSNLQLRVYSFIDAVTSLSGAAAAATAACNCETVPRSRSTANRRRCTQTAQGAENKRQTKQELNSRRPGAIRREVGTAELQYVPKYV
jgi:hypothetical protein